MTRRITGALALGICVPAMVAGGFFPHLLPDLRSADAATAVASDVDLPSPDPFAFQPLELAREVPAGPLEGSPGVALPAELKDRPYTRRVRASFRLKVRDVLIPYRVLGITARPGERIALALDEVWGETEEGAFRLRTPLGVQPSEEPGRWIWEAPSEPGPVPLRIEAPADGDAITLNVLVLHPMEEARNGSMNGFRIGEYRVSDRSTLPPGFIEASPDVLDLRVAPGFTLRQFLPHQPGDPRYLALSEALLLKLEALLEEVKAEGIEAESLYVMSAFRTPHYNRAIGNTTDASRHLWGDAADVFIDETGDGRMDDLTGDGRGGEADARVLYRLAERVENRGEAHVRPGGLSLYRANTVRGPFIHVDARGTAARW